MFNLLVSSNAEDWEGEGFILEVGRSVREYTDKEITEQYGDLTPEQVEEIHRFPCIFAYETQCHKNPKFGIIRDIIRRQGKVKIEYEIVSLEKFISHDELLEMSFDLDISEWEMNRTHWAIKNINLPKELARKGIILPRWARTEEKAVDITNHYFDVALSFPGEVREYVESVAVELEREIGPNSYFYDNNYKAQLARPSLDTLLQDIYKNRSRLVVVFLCAEYQEKEWCGIEFRAVRDIINAREHERVMYIKMDDGDVEGVFRSDGYIDGKRHTPKDVAKFIRERIEFCPNNALHLTAIPLALHSGR